MKPKIPGTPKDKDRSPKAPVDHGFDVKDKKEPQLVGNQQGSKRPGQTDEGGRGH